MRVCASQNGLQLLEATAVGAQLADAHIAWIGSEAVVHPRALWARPQVLSSNPTDHAGQHQPDLHPITAVEANDFNYLAGEHRGCQEIRAFVGTRLPA